MLLIAALSLLPFAATSLASQNTQHLLSLKTSAGQEAQLMGNVGDEDDNNLVIQNPVLVVKNKTYKLARSDSTRALSDLLCRRLGGEHLYSFAKYKKRAKKENSLETDRNLGLKRSKAKIVVREFHCVDE